MKRKVIVISIFIVSILIISIFTITKKTKEEQFKYIETSYLKDATQTKLENEDIDDMILKIDDKDIIGKIKIDKINFEGLVYEGTSLDILEKGVGHIENSPYLDGNVCLAAHNTNKFWAKLNKLDVGDKINYITFLGEKEYLVYDMSEIYETDWSKIENTDENILTLITCVKNNKSKRLCVQAMEIE